VDGPLEIHVAYPHEPNTLIDARDSTFVFGTVGNGGAGLRVNGTLVPVWPNGAFLGWIPVPPVDHQAFDFVAYTATDTARLTYPVRTLAAQPARQPTPVSVTTLASPVAATLYDDSLARAVSDTDALVIGRPTPTGTYKWFLFQGTPVTVTEYRGDMAHVRIDPTQEIWVERRDVRATDATDTLSPLALSQPQLASRPDQVTLTVRSPRPPAYIVEEGDRELTLTLYNSSVTGTLPAATDSLVASATQARDGSRTVYRFALTRPVYGYLALYHDGVLTFSIRRPPVIDPAHPLRGLTIAVDPGHPPIGATGPTGLWEPVPTLAVGMRVRDMLTERGARVVMTRSTPDPVALGDRPIIARRADANALVSIHLNADPDNVNPFRDDGTGTYYFWPHSKPLAAAVQSSLVPQLGLRDRGVLFQNLAVARPTWFPAVLAEGLFIIMPPEEAAIRTPEYQDAYARGLVEGLEKYFAGLAR
jgi:N-acetylmuramoyl-L-alanine amidase